MKKWYSLIDKIYNENNLKEAFKLVKRNHGAPGIDGETVELFAESLTENIEFLHHSLKTNTNYRIVRYADDILIFTKSKQDAQNAKAWATKILEEELKLSVNQDKTSITSLKEGVSFLGFTIFPKYTVIERKRIKRFKDKIRELTKRSSGVPIEITIARLNRYLRVWINYYRIANNKRFCKDNMGWIRRRLRMIKMKQWKTYKAMHKEMRRKGIIHNGEKMNVTLWKNSKVHIIHTILPNS